MEWKYWACNRTVSWWDRPSTRNLLFDSILLLTAQRATDTHGHYIYARAHTHTHTHRLFWFVRRVWWLLITKIQNKYCDSLCSWMWHYILHTSWWKHISSSFVKVSQLILITNKCQWLFEWVGLLLFRWMKPVDPNTRLSVFLIKNMHTFFTVCASQRDNTTEEGFQFQIYKLRICLCIHNTSLHLCLYSFVTIWNSDRSITITRSKQVNVF